MEELLEIYKKGVEEQLCLNRNVDGFCVRYLSDLHSKYNNIIGEITIVPNSTVKQSDDIESDFYNPIEYKSDNDDFSLEKDEYDDDTDSDYNDDIRTTKTSNSKSKGHRRSKSDTTECKGKSKRLSKNSRSYLRKCIIES